MLNILVREKRDNFNISGLAFKPNMNDARESSTLKIIRRLDGEDYKNKTYDHKDTENPKQDLQLLNNEYVNDIFFITIPTKPLKELMS